MNRNRRFNSFQTELDLRHTVTSRLRSYDSSIRGKALSRREVHAAAEGLEARVGSEIIQQKVVFEMDHLRLTLFACDVPVVDRLGDLLD